LVNAGKVVNKDNNAGYNLNVIEKVKETIRKSKKRLINGHQFELRFITDNKNNANRKHGDTVSVVFILELWSNLREYFPFIAVLKWRGREILADSPVKHLRLS